LLLLALTFLQAVKWCLQTLLRGVPARLGCQGSVSCLLTWLLLLHVPASADLLSFWCACMRCALVACEKGLVGELLLVVEEECLAPHAAAAAQGNKPDKATEGRQHVLCFRRSSLRIGQGVVLLLVMQGTCPPGSSS
jgi:hypothetical protein